MENYTECPHYKAAERKEAAWQMSYEAAKKEITEGMRALGLVPETAMVQIENAAAMKADLDEARREARQYTRLQVKKSREGNDSFVTNPIHEQVRTMAATYANMLKDLGFGVKTEKVVTNIGESAVQTEDAASADRRALVDSFRKDFMEKL